MYFGEYLVMKGLATEEEISAALATQRQTNRPLGKHAQQLGVIDKRQNVQILMEQQRTKKLYGEVAVDLGLLTPEQVDLLLSNKRKDTLPLGKILVKQAGISRKKIALALLEFVAEGWRKK